VTFIRAWRAVGRRGRWAPLLVGLGIVLAGCAEAVGTGTTPVTSSSLTPSAGDQSTAVTCSGKPTPAQTEGPFFKAGSPARGSLLEPGVTGTRLLLSGRVLTRACAPVARAVLDFWQASDAGVYDNVGYRLRGNQTAGADGAYHLETIVPGLYTGRTAHIHVKVQPPGQATLTTQLYFPGVARNQQDAIFNAALLISVRDGADAQVGTFDFILDLR